MGLKFVKFMEEAPDFNAGLALAVQIVEREGLRAPWLMIKPTWLYSDEFPDGKIQFDVEVSTTYEDGKEIDDSGNPERFIS